MVYKLFGAYKITHLWQQFLQQTNQLNYILLFLTLLLVFINWGIEVVKWKYLLQIFEPITYQQAIKSILSGVALSIITPNQLGDFVGRVIHLKELNKIKGSLVAVVGHTAQVIVTLTFGVFATVYLLVKKQYLPVENSTYFYAAGLVLVVTSILVYINLQIVFNKINQVKFLVRIKEYLQVFAAYNRKDLMYILALSFVRYGVFLTQYYLLLNFFGVKLGLFTALSCIIATFCVQSVVPSFIFLDIGLRGASAMLFFEMFNQNLIGILLSAYTLWIFNMMLPAMGGLAIIYRTKFLKN